MTVVYILCQFGGVRQKTMDSYMLLWAKVWFVE